MSTQRHTSGHRSNPASASSRTFVFLGIGIVVVLGLWLILRGRAQPETGAADGPGIYYMGPKRSKWDPNVWVMPDGKIVPPPPGAPPAPAGQGRPTLN